MARSDKAATVAELTNEFRTSSAAVLTEYRGLTVAQLKVLRRSLGATTTYAVVNAGVVGFESLLAGPSAIAFVKGDPVEAAKGLRDFSKTNPNLVIKGGYLDGKVLTSADIAKLADLEPREVLLAKLAGAMKASMSQAVSLFAAPLSQAARTVDALRQKVEAATPAAAAPAAVEAPAPAEVEAPAAEEAATTDSTPEAEAPAEAAQD